MWETEHFELGRLEVGTEQEIEFKLALPVPEGFLIEKLLASCGCTEPTATAEGVKVKYTAAPVPRQLLFKGEYTVVKEVKVKTNQGDFKLTFRATIFKET